MYVRMCINAGEYMVYIYICYIIYMLYYIYVYILYIIYILYIYIYVNHTCYINLIDIVQYS